VIAPAIEKERGSPLACQIQIRSTPGLREFSRA
jgi:hypothetical protein